MNRHRNLFSRTIPVASKYVPFIRHRNSFASVTGGFQSNRFLLPKTQANFSPLAIINLLQRTSYQSPSKLAYVHGEKSVTWDECFTRVKKFASALRRVGVKDGDVVSIMAPNSPSIFEAHFAVPGCSAAVLHTINTRLDAKTIAFQLTHAKSKVLLCDSEFGCLVKSALSLLPPTVDRPVVIDIEDDEFSGESVLCGDGKLRYEDFIASGDDDIILYTPKDEWEAITLNYTSGTTGNPKGVLLHHRGAYLNAIGNALEWNMPRYPQYLWIVPLFHCNGWCFAWTMAAMAGTSYFLRQIRAEPLFHIIEKYKVQFMSGAPITMITMLNHPEKRKFKHQVKMWAAGAPPPPAVIKQFQDEIGVSVQTAYGLTETYGPISTHCPDPEWADQSGYSAESALSKCTYQTNGVMLDDMRVLDPQTMKEVPPDGETVGEVMMRGNIVMSGYLNNVEATTEAFEGGWFHSGDLAVNHGRGRLEIKDRSKDVIISGGENISSIEVENILLTHPSILEVAVVAMPDEKWGEVPCAFVVLKPKVSASAEEIISWSRTKMAKFMSPKRVIFADLPKTATGKVQKNELRKLI